jgi:Holliday junction resolvase RusA-like endonuclease
MKRDEIIKRYPNASPSFIARNCDDNAASLPPKASGKRRNEALDRSAQRKRAVEDGAESGARYHIRFTVYSIRPRDWDNLAASLKSLQDAVVAAGWLPDDNWKVLTGEAIPANAKTKAEQRTVIEITRTI